MQLIQPKQYNLNNKLYWKPRGNWWDANVFIIEEAKEAVLDFSKGTVMLLRFLFCFNIIINIMII